MASTLLLDRTAWDLVLDAYGNIARADEPYSITQDVASACRLFFGELWYDEAQGVRYFERVLGKFQALQILKSQLEAAALTVPGVASAQVFVSAVTNRTVSGQVQIVLGDGSTAIVTL